MEVVKIWWYQITITWKEDWSIKNEKHRVHAKFCTVQQCHSTIITEVSDKEIVWQLPYKADWIWWKKEIVNGWVYTADCWSIALLWKESYVVIHAWRRGLYKWMIHEAVKKLCSHWEEVVDINVYFGPSICTENFEFGSECKEYFPCEFIHKVDWKFTVDLVWLAISQLTFHGIERKNIQIHWWCTYWENEKWFSARQWEKERNFLWVSWVWE